MRLSKLTPLLLMLISGLIQAQNGARLLIITHDDYYNALLPLAEWKHQTGLKTKLIRLSEIGSDTNQIHDYIVNAYNTWPVRPEYVMLVGNRYQINWVRFNYQGYISYSDNYYTNISGDYHNEIIPGRIWVDDSFQAQTVTAKILGYEKSPWMDDSLWLRKGMTIVCEDYDSFPADSVYWSDSRYMHDFMINADYFHIDSFSRLRGHNHNNVINSINNGRAYIMYRGVGGGSWSSPFFYIDTLDMHNGFKLPIVISGTCATIDGIGHEWFKAGSAVQPRGIVGFYGTSTLLEHAAEMRSALVCGTIEEIFSDSLATLGMAAEKGRLRYTELFGNSLEYNSWGCLGDPSMRLWTSQPKDIEVACGGNLHQGICSLTVNVTQNAIPQEKALVCISSVNDSSIYAYGYTDNGFIVLSDTFPNPGDSVYLTVTGRNLIPFQTGMRVMQVGAPYIALNRFYLNDSIGGNNDGIANPGETIELEIYLQNIGDTTAWGVFGIIQELQADSFFYLDDTFKFFGDIAPGDTVTTGPDGFNISVSPACPDGRIYELRLTTVDAADSIWSCNIMIQTHRPLLEFITYSFPGGLKYITIGDTNFLYNTLFNAGTYPAVGCHSRIIEADSGVIVIDADASYDTIMPCSISVNINDPFLISVDTIVHTCTPMDMTVEVNTDYSCDTVNFSFYAGQYDYLIWDKDLNHSSGPVIKTILDSLHFYGVLTSGDLVLDDLTLYKSLLVCLGVYPEKYMIHTTNPVGPGIVDYILNRGGKVYMEGGDVFYTDPYYAYGYYFNPTFGLYGLANGVQYLTRVQGQLNSFTNGMSFRHVPTTNTNDRLQNQSNTSLIFTNPDNSYGIAVAAFNRTVGSSFEIGSLVDSIPPSTKRVLIDSIMRYLGINPTGIFENDFADNNIELDIHILPNPSRGYVNFLLQNNSKTTGIKIKIYDVIGRLVWEYGTDSRSAHVIWNCSDNQGRKISAGVYVIRLTGSGKSISKKLVFIE